MKVVLSKRAIEDLIDIGRYIGRNNPTRAASFVAELEARCVTLGDMPKGYPPLPGHEASGIRRRPFGDYLIFYRVEEATPRIDVLRVLRGARDIEAILFAPD
ncbi:type II toxin-antitoxin system RelE/ParE family toxin [Methylobacterium komagatae]|uniref:Type II toxin-antitoxin system RelE/ParE family toxin n=1 Tax=Methylobacterium komagatae TaxID=374425 RepID=A0ABW2BQ86_9HYPH